MASIFVGRWLLWDYACVYSSGCVQLVSPYQPGSVAMNQQNQSSAADITSDKDTSLCH